MITYHNGNLLDTKSGALVNTVNTVGVMGKGVALQFKNAFPHNFKVYREACVSKKLVTGQLLVVKDHNLLLGERVIINFPTKTHWRFPSQYNYIGQGLIALREYLLTNDIESLALPALGCGNGGLEWLTVKSLIEQHLSGIATDIQVYQPNNSKPL